MVGKALDWLQRTQALWTALVALPVVTAAIEGDLGGLSHVPQWQLFLITLFSLVGGLMLLVYARSLRTKHQDGSPTKSSEVLWVYCGIDSRDDGQNNLLLLSVRNNGPTDSFVGQVTSLGGISGGLFRGPVLPSV